jgi:hypothetical protein
VLGLTHVADPALYRDEPPPLSPLLANDALVEPEEPVPTVTRLAVINDRLFVVEETDGGSIESERCLGPLDRVSEWDVPAALRGEFWRIVGEGERDPDWDLENRLQFRRETGR